jgi:uncharacterized RDD family membrane protein YckC
MKLCGEALLRPWRSAESAPSPGCGLPWSSPRASMSRFYAAVSPLGSSTLMIAGLALVVGVWGNNSADLDSGRLTLGLSLGRQPFLLYLLTIFVCYVLFEGARSATPGKLALGLRVVKYDGSRCGWFAALRRSILRPLDALPFAVPYLVGLAAAGLSTRRQRLGDMLAGTLVVKK